MELRVGDRFSDETGEWEVIGRPYTTVGGKNANVRIRLVEQPIVTEMQMWGAHERINVKRTTAEEGNRLGEVASLDLFGIRSHRCPWCYTDLTDSIRPHLYGCGRRHGRRRSSSCREG